jgi:ABC-type amino acid transport system permease subunit
MSGYPTSTVLRARLTLRVVLRAQNSTLVTSDRRVHVTTGENLHSASRGVARFELRRQSQAMWLIIVPQPVRNVLPAAMNQFIVIVKETSLV